MTRVEAVAALENEAWYYQPCPLGDWIDDLFFFGSRAWDDASVLILTSRQTGEEFRVVDVTSFDEANAWHTAFAYCLQRDKFEP